MSKQNKIKIPEIAMFKYGYFGVEIEWFNPFDSISIFELRNNKNELINKAYLQSEPYIMLGIEKYIDKSYSLEIKNIKSGEIKMYSIAY